MAIELGQVEPSSFLRRVRQHVFAPEAANTSKVVASVDPSTLTVGTAMTLQTAVSGKKLRFARFVTLSVDDDDGGGGLSVTVQVTGVRFGQTVTESLTATAVSGTIVTVTGAQMFEQILSVVPRVISNADAGDAVLVGIDGTALGLDCPIKELNDVLSIINVSTNTEAAPVAVSTSSVNVAQSAIIGLTLATTDRYDFDYIVNPLLDQQGNAGVWA